ncbi:MAG: hypothetical protein J5545_06100 [Bacteroidaceae bacterium]|nr:hypothetical protein [Bacteroidaceae bacterium]
MKQENKHTAPESSVNSPKDGRLKPEARDESAESTGASARKDGTTKPEGRVLGAQDKGV